MARTKWYEEGSVFTLPLCDGGFATGVVARCNGKGMIFGYFFGSTIASVDGTNPARDLTAPNAILRGLCGDLGFLEGNWKCVGRIAGYCRKDWPFPRFTCETNDPDMVTVTEYDENSLKDKSVNVMRRLDIDDIGFIEESVMGSGCVEIVMTQLLEQIKGVSESIRVSGTENRQRIQKRE